MYLNTGLVFCVHVYILLYLIVQLRCPFWYSPQARAAPINLRQDSIFKHHFQTISLIVAHYWRPHM